MHALTALVLILAVAPPAFAQMPALPQGLGGQPELPPGLRVPPKLPPGLGGQPELPVGLDERDASGQGAIEAEEPSALFTGFFDLRYGARTQDNSLMPRDILGEGRLHLEAGFGTTIQTRIAFDVVGDAVASDHSVDLHAGAGAFDLREANISFSPFQSMDVKVGRQILTWGTGDLLFINDIFPKDYESFVIGRDIEYLKAPSDAVKLSFFSDYANLDLIYTPQFDADRYINGERVSFFSPIAGGQVGGGASQLICLTTAFQKMNSRSAFIVRSEVLSLPHISTTDFGKAPSAMIPVVRSIPFRSYRWWGAVCAALSAQGF